MASEISNTMVENMASLYVAPYKDGLKMTMMKGMYFSNDNEV